MDNQDQQSEIKMLITKGKEQGFLTYAEVNDHLPDDIVDPEQIEDIISMINDMGIEVHEVAPDAESLLVADKPNMADDDTATEEAVAALSSAVESEVGRTTDPVRMYMREMGTVELLTREGEIAIAKRIEEGLNQVQQALSCFPWSTQLLIEEYEQHLEGKRRMNEVVLGFNDLEVPEVELTEDMLDESGAADAEEEEEDGGEESTPADTGPDPEEVARRMEVLRGLYGKFLGVVKKSGPADKKAAKLREQISEEFLKLKLPPVIIDQFARKLRDVVNTVRGHERAIMDLCIRQAKMPRRVFLKEFPGNEANVEWLGTYLKSREKWVASLKDVRDNVIAEQEKLIGNEQAISLTVHDDQGNQPHHVDR
jgi:RNA polymerase primary sigma factor